jgi:hypothetical protein
MKQGFCLFCFKATEVKLVKVGAGPRRWKCQKCIDMSDRAKKKKAKK